MPNNDYFKLIYCILTQIYESEKCGDKVEIDSISYQRFNIPYSYWLDIMTELSDRKYIRGFKCKDTKVGRVVALDNLSITLDGVQFLEENSMMSKVKEALKDVKDMIPNI